MHAATHPALRQVIRRHAALVRAGVKSLLSTHPHPARARLSGAGLLPADALMRAEPRAAVCPGGGLGGRFFDHGESVFFLSKKSITNGCEKFVSVRNGSKTGGGL